LKTTQPITFAELLSDITGGFKPPPPQGGRA
jgi:hypothetical protein